MPFGGILQAPRCRAITRIVPACGQPPLHCDNSSPRNSNSVRQACEQFPAAMTERARGPIDESDFVKGDNQPVTGKLVAGSRVRQVGPVDSCGQVGDLDLSLVNSRNLSWVGQVRPIDSCGQVRIIDLSGSK